MIGAWCKMTNGLISMENIQKAVNDYFKGTLAENNINGINKAFAEFKFLEMSQVLTS